MPSIQTIHSTLQEPSPSSFLTPSLQGVGRAAAVIFLFLVLLCAAYTGLRRWRRRFIPADLEVSQPSLHQSRLISLQAMAEAKETCSSETPFPFSCPLPCDIPLPPMQRHEFELPFVPDSTQSTPDNATRTLIMNETEADDTQTEEKTKQDADAPIDDKEVAVEVTGKKASEIKIAPDALLAIINVGQVLPETVAIRTLACQHISNVFEDMELDDPEAFNEWLGSHATLPVLKSVQSTLAVVTEPTFIFSEGDSAVVEVYPVVQHVSESRPVIINADRSRPHGETAVIEDPRTSSRSCRPQSIVARSVPTITIEAPLPEPTVRLPKTLPNYRRPTTTTKNKENPSSPQRFTATRTVKSKEVPSSLRCAPTQTRPAIPTKTTRRSTQPRPLSLRRQAFANARELNGIVTQESPRKPRAGRSADVPSRLNLRFPPRSQPSQSLQSFVASVQPGRPVFR